MCMSSTLIVLCLNPLPYSGDRCRDRRQRHCPFPAPALWPWGPSWCVWEGWSWRPSCHRNRQSQWLWVRRFHHSLPQPSYAGVCQTARWIQTHMGTCIFKKYLQYWIPFWVCLCVLCWPLKVWSIVAVWPARRQCLTVRRWFWRRQTGTCWTCSVYGGDTASASYVCRCGWRKLWRNSWGKPGM